MGIGSFLLNWGVLVVGLVLFGIGQLYLSFYVKAYKFHVARYGRYSFGREYGTSWTKADERGVNFARSFWTVVVIGIVGALLFFFAKLAEVGVPLWIGCTLGITGLFLLFFALVSSAGLAKREVEMPFSPPADDRVDDLIAEAVKQTALESRIEHGGGSPEYQKAQALSDAGKDEEAIQWYDKALAIYPNYVEAWYGKGKCLSLLDRYEEAIQCYDNALSINPNYTFVWDSKAEALSIIGRNEEAIEWYDKLLEVYPGSPYDWDGKGIALCALGRYKEALHCFDKVLTLASEGDLNYRNALHRKGDALSELGLHEEAKKCRDKAQSLR